MADDLKEIMDRLAEQYDSSVFSSEKTLYITLGAGADEKWTLFAGPDGVRIEQGKALDQADCVLKTKPDLFIDMVNGDYMPGMMDFMRGIVKTNEPDLLKNFKRALGF